jgi:hypothetical protein
MRILVIAATFVITGMQQTSCYADCNCEDWVKKGGYCVDYVKTRIPTFPVPQSTSEIAVLKNREIPEVTEGDVAMFNFSNYWHVAYVEKVHQDQQGNATAVDVSEMNFGDQMSFNEYKKKWKQKSRSEWKRAICCGVTDNYGQTSSRKNVALNTVKQIWSPLSTVSGVANKERDDAVFFDKVREVFNRLFLFTGREL